jgi:hypothetical protein
MAARKRAQKADPTAWRQTPAGLEKYRAARAEAQRQANTYGYDYGIEWRDTFQEVAYFMLPAKHNRYGHETQCEVVMCEDLARCQPGHGSQATRPPSPTGPDYHGGPWVGREKALEQIAAWEKDWKEKHG